MSVHMRTESNGLTDVILHTRPTNGQTIDDHVLPWAFAFLVARPPARPPGSQWAAGGATGTVLTELSRGRRLESALHDFVEQSFVADFQKPRGFRAVPVDALENLREGLTFGLVRPAAGDVPQALRGERTEAGGRWLHVLAGGHQVLEYLFTIVQHHHSANHVLELADVAAPGMLEKSGRGLRRELFVPPVLLIEFRKEACRQREDLLLPFS